MKKIVCAKPNANFYSLGGKSCTDEESPEYREYRRCWMEYPSRFILRDFPMHVDIEVTSRCNLRCVFCDKLPVLTKDQLGDMDVDLYKKIIDEGAKHRLWGVKLSYRGEPLLHKDILKMIAYAKDKGILDVYFNTNGILLNEKLAEGLIEVGLDRISISVDGVDPVAFEKQRIGAQFDIILKNIDTLMRLKKTRGRDKPRVRVQTINFPDVDLEAYKTFWISHCDEVAAVDYKDGFNRLSGIVQSDWACPQLWQRVTIRWDGTISACNNDDLALLSPGNIRENTVYDCWHDQKIEEARVLHRLGRSHKVKACDGCPWRTTQIKKMERM